MTAPKRNTPRSTRADRPATAGRVRRAAGALLLGAALWGSSPVGAVELFPEDQVRFGLKGQVRTVLRGAEPELLDLEILGLLPDAIAPGVDMILGRLVGEKGAWTGVAAGMSGSPVFVDGQLVGALSYSIGPFSKEPILGITPIRQMLALREQPGGALPWPATSGEGIRPAPLGLVASGVASNLLEQFDDIWKTLGVERPAAGLAASSGTERPKATLEPGDPVAALLIWGDMKVGATGTVTWRDGDQLLAFGHPFLGSGRVSLPLAGAEVVWTVPSLASSFKIVSIGAPVGTMRQDRITAIGGDVGQVPAGVTFNVSIRRPGRPELKRHYQLARDPFLTPGLAALAFRATVLEGVGAERDESLRLAGRIRLEGGRELQFTAGAGPGLLSRDAQLALELSQRLAAVVRAPLSLPDLASIDLTVDCVERDAVWAIKGATPDRLTARPGEEMRVFVDLRGSRGGERREAVDLKIPASAQPGSYALLVGAESTLAGELGSLDEARRRTASTADEYLSSIEAAPADDRLQVALVRPAEGIVGGGREYPALPGVVHLLMRSRPGGADLYRSRFLPVASAGVQLDRTILELARVSLDVVPLESSR